MFSIQQLNEHADKIDNEGIGGEDLTAEVTDPGEIIGKVCGVYKKVRPFLEVINSLFFLPKKWRAAIASFMLVMDGLCPGVANPELG